MQSRLQLSLLQVQMEQKEKIHSSSLSHLQNYSYVGGMDLGRNHEDPRVTLSIGNENHMIVFVVLYITVLDKTVTKVLMGRKPPPPLHLLH